MDAAKEKELIESCLSGNRKAQKQLYDFYSVKVWGLILRYCAQEEEAREILQIGFIRVFEKLSQFQFRGSFEGWVKRIMIHTALEQYRKKEIFSSLPDDENDEQISVDETIHYKLQKEDVLKAMQLLAPGFRTVLNLYAIEAYSHSEIAEMLGISENTSKSQLSRARVALWNELKKRETQKLRGI